MKWEISGYFNRHQHYKRRFGLIGALWIFFNCSSEIKIRRLSQ